MRMKDRLKLWVVSRWMIREGTRNTESGNYIFYDTDFPRKIGPFHISRLWFCKWATALRYILQKSAKVADVEEYIEQGEFIECVDIIFWLRYCPNYQLPEE